MMGIVSKEQLDEYAATLDAAWQESCQVMGAPWKTFGENYGVAQTQRRIKLLKIAGHMAQVVEEMLRLPLHIGNAKYGEEYQKLENLLVKNIARICRIDADTGIRLGKLFLQYNRSFTAVATLHWRSIVARIGFWFDDGIRRA